MSDLLGNKPGSSGRATWALNYCVISPAQMNVLNTSIYVFEFNKYFLCLLCVSHYVLRIVVNFAINIATLYSEFSIQSTSTEVIRTKTEVDGERKQSLGFTSLYIKYHM